MSIFFFNDTATTEIYTLSLHDALPIFADKAARREAEGGDDVADVDPAWRFLSTRSVLPEDALFGNTMFVGKLLMALDEAGGIPSMRYCKGFAMTASVDAMDFYSPISTHEVVTFRAGLNYVGTSSLEVGVKVLAEVPWTGEVRHACSAFLTFVHLGPDLRPRPCPPFAPATEGARRRWAAALARRGAAPGGGAGGEGREGGGLGGGGGVVGGRGAGAAGPARRAVK